MKNALILHGTSNNPNKHWFPWLKTKLEGHGYTVWIPQLPDADQPNMQKYNSFIFQHWKFSKETVLVGHSSGAAAILGVLQELPSDTVIDKAILVGGFTDDLGMKELTHLFNVSLDWPALKKKAKRIILYHSDNDPYVPLRYGEKLKKLLDAELIIMPGQAHFSTTTYPEKEKYKKFPELLEKILV